MVNKKVDLNILFHRIANGQEKRFLVDENETFSAILDIDPIVEGHCLIIPKRNIVEINELKQNEIIDLHELINQVSLLLKKKFMPTGITIMQNGGQNNDVSYLHFHILPRQSNDGFKWEYDENKNLPNLDITLKKILT